jgi:hypothetical protein
MAEKSDKGSAPGYEAEAVAARAKMAKLREPRLAREAEPAASSPPAPAKSPAKGGGKKKAPPKPAGSLADWIKAREDGGHNN